MMFKRSFFSKPFIFILSILLMVESLTPSYALAPVLINMPQPGTMVETSPFFKPPVLKGVRAYPDNPFRFDFIVDGGDDKLSPEQFREQAQPLLKYFLAGLTVPAKDLWVNLSPYENNRIIPDAFGQTEMGRDMLAQDYFLKQLTASLLHPDSSLGKEFWNKIYAEAKKHYGTTNIPIDTFNKVWITPEKASVLEKGHAAFITSIKLKVMLESDYIAISHNPDVSQEDNQTNETQELAKNAIRDIIIPALEKEVNEGKGFSLLRQIFSSLVLATWYKRTLTSSLNAQEYLNANKVLGVGFDDPLDKNSIYKQYVEAFQKGVFQFIREEKDPLSDELIPRKYFSGGVNSTDLKKKIVFSQGIPAASDFSQENTVVISTTVEGITKEHETTTDILYRVLFSVLHTQLNINADSPLAKYMASIIAHVSTAQEEIRPEQYLKDPADIDLFLENYYSMFNLIEQKTKGLKESIREQFRYILGQAQQQVLSLKNLPKPPQNVSRFIIRKWVHDSRNAAGNMKSFWDLIKDDPFLEKFPEEKIANMENLFNEIYDDIAFFNLALKSKYATSPYNKMIDNYDFNEFERIAAKHQRSMTLLRTLIDEIITLFPEDTESPAIYLDKTFSNYFEDFLANGFHEYQDIRKYPNLALIQASWEQVNGLIKKSGITIKRDYNNFQKADIFVSEVDFITAAGNILKNSIEVLSEKWKGSPEATITISSTAVDNKKTGKIENRINFDDNGFGFTSDQIELFKKTGSISTTKGSNGTGVGLASVNAFANNYNGRVEISNIVDENGNISGARISLFFPIEDATPQTTIDNAGLTKGGIDLNTDTLSLDVSHEPGTTPIQEAPSFDQMQNFDGIKPVILAVKPFQSISFFLGEGLAR